MDKPILKPKITPTQDSDALAKLSSQVKALAARKQIFGGNIYIQPNQPINPQPNDIWYNINSLRR